MAPTLVFKGNQLGDFYVATGSPGGGTIIPFVVKNLVAIFRLESGCTTSCSFGKFWCKQ